jgi:hypothetical protein
MPLLKIWSKFVELLLFLSFNLLVCFAIYTLKLFNLAEGIGSIVLYGMSLHLKCNNTWIIMIHPCLLL